MIADLSRLSGSELYGDVAERSPLQERPLRNYWHSCLVVLWIMGHFLLILVVSFIRCKLCDCKRSYGLLVSSQVCRSISFLSGFSLRSPERRIPQRLSDDNRSFSSNRLLKFIIAVNKVKYANLRKKKFVWDHVYVQLNSADSLLFILSIKVLIYLPILLCNSTRTQVHSSTGISVTHQRY